MESSENTYKMTAKKKCLHIKVDSQFKSTSKNTNYSNNSMEENIAKKHGPIPKQQEIAPLPYKDDKSVEMISPLKEDWLYLLPDYNHEQTSIAVNRSILKGRGGYGYVF